MCIEKGSAISKSRSTPFYFQRNFVNKSDSQNLDIITQGSGVELRHWESRLIFVRDNMKSCDKTDILRGLW